MKAGFGGSMRQSGLGIASFVIAMGVLIWQSSLFIRYPRYRLYPLGDPIIMLWWLTAIGLGTAALIRKGRPNQLAIWGLVASILVLALAFIKVAVFAAGSFMIAGVLLVIVRIVRGPKSKVLFPFLLCALGAGVAACVPWLQRRHELALRTDCRSYLKGAAFQMSTYVARHQGAFPPSISSMSDHGQEGMMIALNHGFLRSGPPPGTSVEDWLDHFYIYWPEGVNTPDDYPILYDRKLSYHEGKGINVCHVRVVTGFAGYPVSGDLAFTWDEDAEWLKKFAKEHPEYDIPLPEDVK